ncbi:MAG: efflux RND transporter periplasmic adaptor subunit, partial [Deltaproteobacteria bacterium]|nr:efflux RND transporter periplasmic adaptor subunit [Deltaproteobacteria bacterium]
TALTKRNDQQGVFLVDTQHMKARFVPITVGIVNGGLVEVLRPSLSGSVVTLGHHLLEDGSPITLPGALPKSPSSRPVNPDSPSGGKRTRSR